MPSSFELASLEAAIFDSMRHLGEGEAQLESALGCEMIEARGLVPHLLLSFLSDIR